MTWDEPDPPPALPPGTYTWRRFLRELLVAVAILAVGLPLVLLLGRGTQDAAELDAATGPPAYVLSGSSLKRSVSQDALRALGFTPQVEVVTGAGFARARNGRPLAVLARERNVADYELLVLQGGEADNIAADGELGVALTHLLDYVDEAAPELPIVIIGPIPSGPGVPAGLRRSNVTIAQVCAARDVPCVDAVSLGWTADDPDLASKLQESLGRLGFTG